MANLTPTALHSAFILLYGGGFAVCLAGDVVTCLAGDVVTDDDASDAVLLNSVSQGCGVDYEELMGTGLTHP